MSGTSSSASKLRGYVGRAADLRAGVASSHLDIVVL